MGEQTPQSIDLEALARRARSASPQMMTASTAQKNACLLRLAELLEQRSGDILAANEQDMTAARAGGLDAAFLDRLQLTKARVAKVCEGVRQVAALPDPVGIVTTGYRRPNKLEILKKRVPLGVVGIFFESRPNVVVDAGILCLKSGNCSILKGGKEAYNSQDVLIDCIRQALGDTGLPKDACQGIATSDREAFKRLLKQDQYIDIVIPRGGEGLIRSVVEHSTIPVIKHYEGICHVYVDEYADLEMAQNIAFNAKVQRPGVCNAMETLLVHEAVAAEFLPAYVMRMKDAGVELRGCPKTRAVAEGVLEASEEDWRTEYLALILSIRTVGSFDEAVAHIERYGSRHTDAIVTKDIGRAQQFVEQVDSSSVMVNASTRFSDGFEYGLGAEIGISTDKLHARGPMGLESLTCEKWVVMGTGQIRE